MANGKRAVNSRREVHGAGWLAGMKPDEDVSEAVVERVGLPGRQVERANDGLERGAVAEIKARQQSGVVAQERDRGRSLPRSALQGAWFGRARARRFFGFDGKIGGQPFRDTAFEDANLNALAQKLGRDMGADQLVGI